MSLTQQKCRPCEGIGRTLKSEEIKKFLKDVPHWQVATDGKDISREWVTKDFLAAIGFINCIAPVAEADNHHPDIHLMSYRKVKVVLSTHALGGLTENDFILAAKINELPVALKKK